MKTTSLFLVLLALFIGCGPSAETPEEPRPEAVAEGEAETEAKPEADVEGVRAVYFSEGIPLEPDAAAWKKAPGKRLTLSPQAIVPPQGGGTIAEITVQALHDGSNIAIRLEGKDETINREVGTSTFRDAVAVGFPTRVTETLPSPFMGDPDHPVNIWQWTADFDAASNGMSGFAEKYPHTEGVWYFPQDPAISRQVRAWRGFEPVIELAASGFGTLERDLSQNVHGSSRHEDGRWRVVLRRELSTGFPEDTLFMAGSDTHLVVAVWDGTKKQVNGKKSVTMNWVPLELDATMVADARGGDAR
jgi:hypothetical protein